LKFIGCATILLIVREKITHRYLIGISWYHLGPGGRGAISTLFFILALISIACGIATTIMIASFLSRHGIKINYLFLRVLIFKYVRQYRKITIEEIGKPGPLFYMFITTWNLALLFAIVGVILKITVE